MNAINHSRKARGIVAVRAESQSGDIKAIVAELNNTFAQFREANDERLKQVEKGVEDAVTAEKVDSINASVTDLQEKLDAALKDVANLQVGGSGVDAEAQEKLEVSARTFLSGVNNQPDYKVTPDDVEAYQQYNQAFASWLRRGDAARAVGDLDVKSAMQVGSDPDGGQWVPTQMSDRIIKRMFETSAMREICDVVPVTVGDSVTWPTDTNDISTGGFVGETETRSETDTPEVGEQTIYLREQYAMPIVTQKLLDMSSIDVEAWLAGKIADKFTRVENARFVTGTGVKAPRGFLDYKSAATTDDDADRAWGVLQYVPSGAAGAFPNASGISGAKDPDAIWDMISKLKPEYRDGARWTMNRATEAAVRKLKDADGNYFIGPLSGGATSFDLGGYPITTLEDMPDIGSNSYSIAFGNFMAGYQILDGRGFRTLRDNLTTKGKVKFYTTKWTGGDVVDFDAIKLMKFAAS